MSNAKLITNTTEDIKAFAEKIANSDRPLSKLEILNMYAAATQGPKTVWGGITNAKKPVVSQRAAEFQKRSSEAAVAADEVSLSDGAAVKLSDDFYEGKYSLDVKVTASPSGIRIETDNGQEVLVEYYEDKFSVRMYNDLSQSPVSVHSQPGHAIAFDAWGYKANKLPATEHAPAAGAKTGRIIGFQVSDTMSGEMYDGKPEDLVMTYKDAQELLDKAYEDDHRNFMMVAVHEGEIHEPVFKDVDAEDAPSEGLASVSHVVLQCFDGSSGYQEHCDLVNATGFNVYLRVPTPEGDDPYEMVGEQDLDDLEGARRYAKELCAKHKVGRVFEDLGETSQSLKM